MDEGAKIASVRQVWSDFAVRYTQTSNRRVTLQCAREMHAHMALSAAHSVLEVAAGAGLGSLDIAQRMAAGTTANTSKKQLVVTDLSPTMVKLAKTTLKNTSTELLDVHVMEANGQVLADITTGAMDRVISNLCLQLTPDPDAMLHEAKRVLKAGGIAGFTIWGRPEFGGFFTIDTAANKEVGLSDEAEHSNFALGKDLSAVRHRFAEAGFSQVRIWPFLCVLELWSGEDYAKFQEEMFYVEDEELCARRFEVARRMADEWLAAKGFPIGLETYIVIAKA